MAIKHETELYAPVKAYLEELGYSVRGEVNHCDLVAIRGEEPPVIVELKKSFSIPLLLQAIDRSRMTRKRLRRLRVAGQRPGPARRQLARAPQAVRDARDRDAHGPIL
ncbi:hypothetical protein LJK88_39165 [Paenibacillus sp. P26]|nr:hypothetical protein LJK88_39165 [Paenibacillus sp. P26]